MNLSAHAVYALYTAVYPPIILLHSTIEYGLSQSELLIGRRLKTQLPVLPSTLKPRSTTSDLKKVVVKEKLYGTKQEETLNKRHRTRELAPLKTAGTVWVKVQSKEGRILPPTQFPRSYLVKTDDKGICPDVTSRP